MYSYPIQGSYPVQSTMWGEPRSRSLTSSPSYRMMGMESSSLYSSPANQWVVGHSPSGSLGPSPLSSPRGLHSTYSYPIPMQSPHTVSAGFMDPRLPIFTSHMNPPAHFPMLSASPQPPMAPPLLHSSFGRAGDVRPRNAGVISPTASNANRPVVASVTKTAPAKQAPPPNTKKAPPPNRQEAPLRSNKPSQPSPDALSWHETSASSLPNMVSASPPPAMLSASPRRPVASLSPRVIEHGPLRAPPPSRPEATEAPPKPPPRSDCEDSASSESEDSDDSGSSDDGLLMPRPDITVRSSQTSKVSPVAPLPLWQLQLDKVDKVLEKYKTMDKPRNQLEEPIRDRSRQTASNTHKALWEVEDRGNRRDEPSEHRGMFAPRGIGDATRQTPLAPPSTPQTMLQTNVQDVNPGVRSQPSRTDVGPGIIVGRTAVDDAPRVVTIINESPAARNGKIQLDDVLLAVDGTSVQDMSTEAISTLLNGPEGTVCSLDLVREGGLPFVVDITRLESFKKTPRAPEPPAEQAGDSKPQASIPTVVLVEQAQREEKRGREEEEYAARPPEQHGSSVGLGAVQERPRPQTSIPTVGPAEQARREEKRGRGEEEDAHKREVVPRVPENDESGGITLVLMEDIELVKGQGKKYEQALVTDLAAAVDAHTHRFAFVGCEEGTEPGTILVHVNVRPAPASTMDRRTAFTLSHEIGKQIEHSTSKLRSSPLTRGTLHVGLHQPLKRVDTPQSTPRKPDVAREVREPVPQQDAGASLLGLLNQVRQAKLTENKPQPAAREVVTQAAQPENGRAAQRHWNNTQNFWDALSREVDSDSRSQSQEEQQQVEKTTPRDTPIVDNEAYWRALDRDQRSALRELATASQQAEREAEQLRLDNERLRKHFQDRTAHTPLASAPSAQPARSASSWYLSPRQSTLHPYSQAPSAGWAVHRIDPSHRLLPAGTSNARPVR